MTQEEDGRNDGRKRDPVGFAIAAGLLALAGAVARDAMGMGAVSSYAGIGPSAASWAVAAGLAALAAGTIVAAVRGKIPVPEQSDNAAVLTILAGIAAMIATITAGGGFIPAMALLFGLTARGFGRRALATDLGIGVVLGLLVYLGFTKLLALSLPQGPIERLF
ncbi:MULTISPECIES: tripartite tricarboxylate transporter TctB family protein [Chelatococcus]|uniref:Putative tricarboxylic transport membrane protein n=1 Tax=Chelatococcus caeni TaxID=1348468 RepID=A0A840BS04_9HYPH|nr:MULTISPECIES: tripartite tricarboxylate transporter TctB family protein [Chelatococcus]ALA18386.1 tripartite tricarboxylate transporter TctB [Chelatococcus sp. CO-6]MBB4015544.1 putative tricarboxylic transport membrane protein [Chelatococcus caeni]